MEIEIHKNNKIALFLDNNLPQRCYTAYSVLVVSMLVQNKTNKYFSSILLQAFLIPQNENTET